VSGGPSTITPTDESSQSQLGETGFGLRQKGLPSGRAGYPPEGRPCRSTAWVVVPSNRRLLVSSSSKQAADPLMHLELICPGARGHRRLAPRRKRGLCQAAPHPRRGAVAGVDPVRPRTRSANLSADAEMDTPQKEALRACRQGPASWSSWCGGKGKGDHEAVTSVRCVDTGPM
jgi:hypothetical protein